MMLDFTSALYLGLWHSSDVLQPWSRLTTGGPAALVPSPGATDIAAQLAWLQGCDRATLAASTLHLFWDLFGLLAREHIALYIDAKAYPIAQWGAVHAAARGIPVQHFPHHDVSALQQLVRRNGNRRPVVVADGLCVCCGVATPLAAYLEVIRPYDGHLVLDDTQALGLLGSPHSTEMPYGVGGGGSLRRSGQRGEELILVCSLAKAFGVPIAVLSGSRRLVEQFEATSQTRVHCSPPSVAHLHAAAHALVLNTAVGDVLRGRLVRRVRFFREQLNACGLEASGGLLPNQSLPPLPVTAAVRLHQQLLAAGVRVALLGGDHGTGRLRFILTARHRPEVIHRAVSVLARLIEPWPNWFEEGGATWRSFPMKRLSILPS